MYKEMELDELVERAQETDGTEGDALKAELARRYREGDGVARDENEAAYWESCMETSAASAPQEAPATQKEVIPEIVPEEDETAGEDPEAYYRSLSEAELYQAFRSNKPWATFVFAQRMMEAGDSTGLAELKALSDNLERGFEAGILNAGLLKLYIKVLLTCGSAYENGVSVLRDLVAARTCFEKALELGSSEAIPNLLRCYDKLGILQTNPDDVMPLVHKLESGDAAGKLAAAKVYDKLGRMTYAGINFETVAQDASADISLRADALVELEHMGRRTTDDIVEQANRGDAAASFAAAHLYMTQDEYGRAEEMLAQAERQEPGMETAVREKGEALRHKREQNAQRLAKEAEDAVKEAEHAQERERIRLERAAEEERVRQERAAEQERIRREEIRQERRENGVFRRFSRWLGRAFSAHPILTVIGVIWALNLAVYLILLPFIAVNSISKNLSLEEVDIFENIDLHYSGAAPYATVEVLNNSRNGFLQTVKYTVTPSENLKNGDKVTVTANYDKSAATKAGFKIGKTKKTYTVSDLGSYVTDASQIDEDCLAAMEQQARDMIEAKKANYSADECFHIFNHLTNSDAIRGLNSLRFETGDELTKSTSYMLTLKDGYDIRGNDVNRYIITYGFPAEMSSPSYGTFDDIAYYSVVFFNISVDEGGKANVSLSQAVLCEIEGSEDDVYANRVSRFKDTYIVTEIEPQ